MQALMRRTFRTQTVPVDMAAAVPVLPTAVAEEAPRGDLALRVGAGSADAGPDGCVRGGWIMSSMSAAAAAAAGRAAHGPVVAVAVSKVTLLRPVAIGDELCCYTEVVRLGTTSITLAVEAWILRQGQGEAVKLTDAQYTFVAVDGDGRPRPVMVA